MKIVHKAVYRPRSEGGRIPAIGECACCFRPVVLSGFTNSCPCGADYNGSGQLLAPREQWGEETGEHIADILRIK